MPTQLYLVSSVDRVLVCWFWFHADPVWILRWLSSAPFRGVLCTLHMLARYCCTDLCFHEGAVAFAIRVFREEGVFHYFGRRSVLHSKSFRSYTKDSHFYAVLLTRFLRSRDFLNTFHWCLHVLVIFIFEYHLRNERQIT